MLFCAEEISIFAPVNRKEVINCMLIIPIKEGENIDKALKRYKRKYDRTGVMRNLRGRQQYTKPSIQRRTVIQKAKYLQNILSQEGV